jgi:hypothetical protein
MVGEDAENEVVPEEEFEAFMRFGESREELEKSIVALANKWVNAGRRISLVRDKAIGCVLTPDVRPFERYPGSGRTE